MDLGAHAFPVRAAQEPLCPKKPRGALWVRVRPAVLRRRSRLGVLIHAIQAGRKARGRVRDIGALGVVGGLRELAKAFLELGDFAKDRIGSFASGFDFGLLTGDFGFEVGHDLFGRATVVGAGCHDFNSLW